MCDDINGDGTAVADAVDAADATGSVPGAVTLPDHPLMRNVSVFSSHALLAIPDGPDSSRDMSDTDGIQCFDIGPTADETTPRHMSTPRHHMWTTCRHLPTVC